jgi:hypothetical protein
MRKAIALRLWFLRGLDALPARELALVWRAIEVNAAEVPGSAQLQGDPARSAAELAAGEALLRRGEPDAAAARLSRALAWDPESTAARAALIAAFAAAPGGETNPGQEPLRGATGQVVLADAGELLARPELLARYVARMAGRRDVTLAIDASEMDAAEAERALGTLVDLIPGAEELDLLAVLGPLDATGRARLASGADAVLSERPSELVAPRL